MQRFSARAVVVGDRAGTVVPDAVLDVSDGLISWVGPAADAPAAPGVPVTASARRSTTWSRRPSEKLGTHSTSLATHPSCHVCRTAEGCPRRA